MAEVPASPPKRMTRSRAKAVEKLETKTSIASSTGKSDFKNKRINVSNVRKLAESDLASQRVDNVSMERAARDKFATKTAETTIKATRGRPRKNLELENVDATEYNHRTPPITTRTRAAATAPATKPPSLKSRNVSKKKVTFQDNAEADKENVFEPIIAKKSVTTGRKTSSTRNKATPSLDTGQKGSKTAKKFPRHPSKDNVGINEAKGKVLSPKKGDQVAKVASTESDDELSGEKTPLKPLNKSPLKFTQAFMHKSPAKISIPQMPQMPLDSPYREENAGGIDELQESTTHFISPVRAFHGSIIASPARRLPQSPFKDGFKLNARRTATTPSKESLESSSSVRDFMLSKSPVKFNLGVSMRSTQGEYSNNTSPKISFLQSPARKPMSPLKNAITGPAMITETATMKTSLSTPKISMNSRMLSLHSSSNVVNSAKATVLSECIAKTPRLTPEGQAKTMSAQNSKIPVRSPPRLPYTGVRYAGTEVIQSTYSPDMETAIKVECRTNSPDRGFLSSNSNDKINLRIPVGHNPLEEESEDELQVTEVHSSIATPTPTRVNKTLDETSTPGPMTVLAERFMHWQGATPDENSLKQRKVGKSLFSPIKLDTAGSVHTKSMRDEISPTLSPVSEPEPVSEFEQAMAIREDTGEFSNAEPNFDMEAVFAKPVLSDDSEEYGDENSVLFDPYALAAPRDLTITCTPAQVFQVPPKVFHTVSKVPLKPAADEDGSPLKIKPLRRRKSMSNALLPRTDLTTQGSDERNTADMLNLSSSVDQLKIPATPQKSYLSAESISNQQHSMDTRVATTTPGRTPRPDLNSQLLRGAVVFVDVHTTEGADASGIFVELLGQMGAKCVKQWSWNPRSSTRGQASLDGENGKIGITHVVFKDGGKRTIEKVKDTNGVVLCVGVGWVLDCERENQWLDENEYAVDISNVPRGGYRRRKSMEPKRLSSFNGNIFEKHSSSTPNMSPSKEFLYLETPKSRRGTVLADMPATNRELSLGTGLSETLESMPSLSDPMTNQTDFTPKRFTDEDATSNFASPNTPYFLHADQLVQHTCPPKQTQQLLFPLSGEIEDQPDEAVRRRLWLARRKSMQWAPKFSSPLKSGTATCGTMVP